MSTISGHTTRAAGTILTASIYNSDHVNHITNAQTLNTDKVEGTAPPVVDGHGVLWNGTAGNSFKTAGYVPLSASAGAVLTANLADDNVTNAKLAEVATATFKGRTTAGTGNPEDMTATQSTALLNNMVGDSGSGGTKGLAPAPGAGDAAAGKFLKADATYAVPPGPLAATQAEMEAGSSTIAFSSPGRHHFHLSSAKAEVNFNSAGTVAFGYNITSITDNGTGDWTVNIATDFSSANYVGVVFGGEVGTTPLFYGVIAIAAGTFRINASSLSIVCSVLVYTPTDPTTVNQIHVVFFGDQA